MLKHTYKYLYLDVGNVLFHDLAVDMNFSYFIYEKLKPQAQQVFFEIRESELKRENLKWIYDFCTKNKVNNLEEVNAKAWGKVLENWLEINVPIGHAIEALEQLHRHIPISIAANQPSKTEKLLEQHGITEFVDQVLLDDELGVGKPSDEFYERILELTGQKAEDTLYVGDRVDNDIIPAIKNGITPIWIKYQPVKVHSPMVPDWWEQSFYESYLKVGPYNMWKYDRGFDENKLLHKYSNLYDFAERALS